ncbi:MAG: ribonuclease HI, partial [Bacteroidales bacterium]|nr:ribonuclease HI [Bacteroidales bacterium]
FVIWENKNMLDFNNNHKIITFNHREKEIDCSFSTSVQADITVFTDGSFNEQEKKGAFSVIIKNEKGQLNLFTQTVKARNNNEVELLAAVKALELVEHFSTVLLYTDSRYVKKGITEWIFYWKINNWMTANGTRAKNILIWKKFLSLTVGKIIQFGWIKGHAETPENKFCDFYAKRALKRWTE